MAAVPVPSRRAKAILLVAVVAATHYGYHFVPGDSWAQARAFYVLRSIEGVVLGALLINSFTDGAKVVNSLGFIACVWLIAEEAQCGICQAFSWYAPHAPSSRLCVDRFGMEPYVLAGTAPLSVVIMWIFKKWKAPLP